MAKKENNKDVKKTPKNEKNKKTFFKSFKTELKKVVWPTPKQLFNSTVTVITIVLICAAIVFVLDIAFETINKQGINRIRDAVVPQETTEQENTNTESGEGEDTTTLQVNEDGSTEVTGGDNSVQVTTDDQNSETSEENNAESTSEEGSQEAEQPAQ